MPDTLSGVDPMHLDAFREIGNIGAGNAVTALSEILGNRIDMEIPIARIVPFGSIAGILYGAETPVAGVLVGMHGDMEGYILIILQVEDAMKIAARASGVTVPDNVSPQDLGEEERGAVTEIANILVGSFLTAIGAQTGLSVRPSVPEMAVDMLGAILGVAVVEYGTVGESVLLLETRFSDSDIDVNGHFFLIPDFNSYKKLIDSLGI
jgi:chemotaxis protein CheC